MSLKIVLFSLLLTGSMGLRMTWAQGEDVHGPGKWTVRIGAHVPGPGEVDLAKDDLSRDKYIERLTLVASEKDVEITQWCGRIGNNLHQLSHAILFAESKGIPIVKIPKKGPVRTLFNLPKVLHVQPKLSSSANCTYNDEYFYEHCTAGWKKSEFRRALLTYVKPHIKPEVDKVCQAQKGTTQGLAIHLRGEDLRDSSHQQARMPPCSFYRHLIEAHDFSGVTIVAQDGKNDLCRNKIMTAFNQSTLLVKETSNSLIDDACTLMTSQYVTFALSTFPEALTMMNEQLLKVYLPALKYNGKGEDIQYGSQGDIAGALECGFNGQNCGNIGYELYEIPGLEKGRRGKDKKDYLVQEDITYSQVKLSCGTPASP